MSDKTYKTLTRPYDNFLTRSAEDSSNQGSSARSGATPEGTTLGGGGIGGSTVNGNIEKKNVRNDGNFDDVWIRTFIRSENWKPKTIGFYIDGRDGRAEFSKVYINGEIHAQSGSIDGVMAVGVDEDNIIIDGPNTTIKSANYVSGAFGTGFYLSPDLFEVGNIACRGMFRASVFQKDIINVIAGSFVVSPNGDALEVDMTALDSSTITIKGTVTFSVGDIIRLKETNGANIEDEWMRIIGTINAPTYDIVRDLAGLYDTDNNPAWKKGTAVVNYGQSGSGGVYMTASDTNAPYLSIFDHSGSPWSTLNTRVRLGNLNGYLGYNEDLYGIAIGDNTRYLKYDPTNGLRIKGNISATTGTIGGWVIGATSLQDAAGAVGMSSAVTAGDDIRFWAGSTTPSSAEFRVTESGSLTATDATLNGVLKAGSCWVGEISGHTGLSLNGTTDYNNIFFKRTSDGIVFFRVNSGGATSMTYDSSSGNLAIVGGTVTGGLIRTSSSGVRIQLNGTSGRIEMTDSAGTIKGSIYTTTGSDLVLNATDDVQMYAGGSKRCHFGSNGLYRDTSGYDIGTSSERFGDGYFEYLNSSGTIKGSYQSSDGSSGTTTTREIVHWVTTTRLYTRDFTFKNGILTNVSSEHTYSF